MTRKEAIARIKDHMSVHKICEERAVKITEALSMAISALEQPEPKWIPCSDVPDTDRNVFIARGEQGNMTVCIGHYEHDYKQWYEDRNWFAKCLYDGLYWCEIPPFPEPYREEGD